jgi:hypothetical protein
MGDAAEETVCRPWESDTLKYRGALKSSMGSITQIHSLTQGEQTRISLRVKQLIHHSQPHMCINILKEQVVIIAVETKQQINSKQ